VARREHPRIAARPRAIDFTVLTDAFLTPEPGTSAADHLPPVAVSDGVVPVGVAAHPPQRAGLPAVVAPVSVPLSTGTGVAVAID
jgi:hypothetical protein